MKELRTCLALIGNEAPFSSACFLEFLPLAGGDVHKRHGGMKLVSLTAYFLGPGSAATLRDSGLQGSPGVNRLWDALGD